MVFGFDQTSYDAIFFVDGESVVKEMLLTEFEAVLDGVVGEPEFSDQTCHAVYLKIDRQLDIVGAVFFLIGFERNGAADKRWNIPLTQLAETAAFGPELQGKPVRIASRSQCQIPWHQAELWEPDLSVSSNLLKVLDATVKANRLGLLRESDVAASSPSLKSGEDVDVYAADDEDHIEDAAVTEQAAAQQELLEQERYKMAQSIKKQRLFIANLKARHEQELDETRMSIARERDVLGTAARELQARVEELDSKYQQAQQDIAEKNEALEAQRSDFEKRFDRMVDQQGIDHQALREQYRKDFQQKLIEQTSGLEAQLEMREVEVYYREEQISRLKSELREVSEKCERLQSRTVESQITELVENGVHFVVSQPGLGPISIPSQDLARFNEQPNAYLAQRLGVERDVYEAWLEHCKLPMCNGDSHSGAVCGNIIDTVPTPQEFVIGVSDRCPLHQRGSLTVVGNR